MSWRYVVVVVIVLMLILVDVGVVGDCGIGIQ